MRRSFHARASAGDSASVVRSWQDRPARNSAARARSTGRRRRCGEHALPGLAVVAEPRAGRGRAVARRDDVDRLELHAVALGDLDVRRQRRVAPIRAHRRRPPRQPIRHRPDRRQDLAGVRAGRRGAQGQRRVADAERLAAVRVAQEADHRRQLRRARRLQPVDPHDRRPDVAGALVAVVVDPQEAGGLAPHLQPVPAPQRGLRGRVVAGRVAQDRGIVRDQRDQHDGGGGHVIPPRCRWPPPWSSCRPPPSPARAAACRSARPRRSRPPPAARRSPGSCRTACRPASSGSAAGSWRSAAESRAICSLCALPVTSIR